MKRALLAIVLFAGANTASMAQFAERGIFSDNGTEIYDSRGTFVGYLISNQLVQRRIGKQWIAFSVIATGITNIVTALNEYFTSTDCSGTAYAVAGDLPTQGQIMAGKIYYPTPPFTTKLVLYSFTFDGTCHFLNGGQENLLVGPVASYTLPAFVPPFSAR
ncbi:MAG TPA: hypothetical protein VME69_02760 [Methylocella sp.]|nr:hypothetical protein [Methylocella sp.]